MKITFKKQMKIMFKQESYSSFSMTLNLEELNTVLDNIGEDQIGEIQVYIRKPEVDNGKED